ncbi:MAG: septum formation protein Maf [Anaerolinea sp. 4484_236]|nr:MAG: septum formation protein Maf [Anaerolinea sp. 4484_236]
MLLASNSPRRRELLAFTGLPFSVAAADVDESILPDEAPADYVLRLAEAKARACCPSRPPLAPPASEGRTSPINEKRLTVIGSDTAVVDAREILGKPRDAREAESMLRQLRGRTHQVYTAIAAYRPQDGKLLTELCISDVHMRAYSDDELAAYVQSGDPLDKAGGYGIQHPDFHPIENFDGCQASVMGLPMCHLVRLLKEMDILPAVDVPETCQSALKYQCSISHAVLRGENIG